MRQSETDKQERLYTPSPDVVYQEVSGETVLLHLDKELYFGLNPIGGRIWELVQQGQSKERIINQLTSEFDADRDIIAADVNELIKQLLESDLLIESPNIPC